MFHAQQGVFFANFEGLNVRDELDVQHIRHALLARLVPLDRRVPVVVAYDNFQVQPEAMDAYVQIVTEVVQAHYERVSRYTTSAFLRSKLGQALQQRGVAPHIFEHEQEAHEHLRRIEDAAALGINPKSN